MKQQRIHPQPLQLDVQPVLLPGMRSITVLLALVLSFGSPPAVAQEPAGPTRLLRFPDMHGDRVVFTTGGDLWTCHRDGSAVTRLTSARGVELFAKFSPNGQWIAFTGQVDGDEQVYVIPSTGGVPTQLTT